MNTVDFLNSTIDKYNALRLKKIKLIYIYIYLKETCSNKSVIFKYTQSNSPKRQRQEMLASRGAAAS